MQFIQRLRMGGLLSFPPDMDFFEVPCVSHNAQIFQNNGYSPTRVISRWYSTRSNTGTGQYSTSI